ncbi:MAG: putative toxin-antitoxin system toxin component, PIN family [Acidimicrobiales bacterium]
MRVVLDPNVIVSALLSRGTTAAVWRRWLEDNAYTPIVCPMLLAELEGVLAREKFARIGKETTRLTIDRLRTDAIPANDPAIVAGVTSDPNDDYLIALASQTEADGIVSGDPHLQSASGISIPVYTPADFLELLGEPTE